VIFSVTEIERLNACHRPKVNLTVGDMTTEKIHNEESRLLHTSNLQWVEVFGAAFRDVQSFLHVGGHFEDTTCEFSKAVCLHHSKSVTFYALLTYS